MANRSYRRLALWLVLVLALLLVAGAVFFMPWPRLVLGLMMGPIEPATPQELAAAQAAYDRTERNGARGTRFYALADAVDRTGRGTMTEAEVVQRLGPPDGLAQYGQRRLVVYYYDRFGKRDWFALAEFQAGVLLNFGYNGTPMLPPSELIPYVAPSAGPNPAAGATTLPTQPVAR